MRVRFGDLSGGIKFLMIVVVMGVLAATFLTKFEYKRVINQNVLLSDNSGFYYKVNYNGKDILVPKGTASFEFQDVPVHLKDGSVLLNLSVVYTFIDTTQKGIENGIVVLLNNTNGLEPNLYKKYVYNALISGINKYSKNYSISESRDSSLGVFTNPSNYTGAQIIKKSFEEIGLKLVSIQLLSDPEYTTR